MKKIIKIFGVTCFGITAGIFSTINTSCTPKVNFDGIQLNSYADLDNFVFNELPIHSEIVGNFLDKTSRDSQMLNFLQTNISASSNNYSKDFIISEVYYELRGKFDMGPAQVAGSNNFLNLNGRVFNRESNDGSQIFTCTCNKSDENFYHLELKNEAGQDMIDYGLQIILEQADQGNITYRIPNFSTIELYVANHGYTFMLIPNRFPNLKLPTR